MSYNLQLLFAKKYFIVFLSPCYIAALAAAAAERTLHKLKISILTVINVHNYQKL